MSQNDFTIANQTFPNFRSDLNDALQALASLSSGSTPPSTTYANMLWYDTGNNTLKMRTEADDAWIDVGYLCQSTNKFCIFDDTNVVDTSGNQVGLIGAQSTTDWEAGSSTTESLVSPEKVKAAIDANVPAPAGLGIGQTWQDMSAYRSFGTTYVNTTGNPIMINISSSGNNNVTNRVSIDSGPFISFAEDRNGGNFVTARGNIVIPAGSNYEVFGGSFQDWWELR